MRQFSDNWTGGEWIFSVWYEIADGNTRDKGGNSEKETCNKSFKADCRAFELRVDRPELMFRMVQLSRNWKDTMPKALDFSMRKNAVPD